MAIRAIMALGLAATGLAGCATTAGAPPAEAIRYHLGQVERGTALVQPAGGTPGAAPSLEYQSYLSAVEAELAANGYARPAPGAQPQFVVDVAFRRGTELGPPRPSPFSIGIGGGGASFGRRSAVGVGGGVSFPVGGDRRGRELVVSELQVTIKRRADQSRVWEGSARAGADVRDPGAATDALARRLARALFTGFPGESGRTIEVR